MARKSGEGNYGGDSRKNQLILDAHHTLSIVQEAPRQTF
jgi:hypothetical protein